MPSNSSFSFLDRSFACREPGKRVLADGEVSESETTGYGFAPANPREQRSRRSLY
jgi:hypothetical protein